MKVQLNQLSIKHVYLCFSSILRLSFVGDIWGTVNMSTFVDLFEFDIQLFRFYWFSHSEEKIQMNARIKLNVWLVLVGTDVQSQ